MLVLYAFRRGNYILICLYYYDDHLTVSITSLVMPYYLLTCYVHKLHTTVIDVSQLKPLYKLNIVKNKAIKKDKAWNIKYCTNVPIYNIHVY